MNFPMIPDLRAYLQQFTKFPIGVDGQGRPRPLCREDYDWSSIQVKVNLGGAVANDPVSDEEIYNGPKNFHSLVFGIQAHIGSNDLSDETLSIPNTGNPSGQDRYELVARNTKVELENIDKQGGSKLFHNAPKRLASLLEGIWLPAPIIIANADSVKVTCSFADQDLAAIASGDWDVGVDLWILQVRAE